MNDIELTEREMLIARRAAELAISTLREDQHKIAEQAASIAVQRLSDEFYRSIGKNVIQRWLIWIGLLAAGFAGGKGWLTALLGKG